MVDIGTLMFCAHYLEQSTKCVYCVTEQQLDMCFQYWKCEASLYPIYLLVYRHQFAVTEFHMSSYKLVWYSSLIKDCLATQDKKQNCLISHLIFQFPLFS